MAGTAEVVTEMVKTDEHVDQMRLVPAVFRMATAYWASQTIYVAAKLGIADVLGENCKSGDEIANATGANSESLARLTRALVGLGVLAVDDNGFFWLTGIGAPLQSATPGSLRSIILTFGEEHYRAWGNLIDSVKCDKPAFNEVYGLPLFEYLGQNSAAAQTFNEAMTDLTSQVALAVVLAYDFSGSRVVADIGGGHGVLLDSILRANPSTMGILFDTKLVIEGAMGIGSSGVSDRRQDLGGDFFEFVPPQTSTFSKMSCMTGATIRPSAS